jgi:hypothetical protein
MTYKVAIFENNVYKTGHNFNMRTHAEDYFFSIVEELTAQDGFYIEDKSDDCYTVFDLSYSLRTIRLMGKINDDIKSSLKHRFTELLKKRLAA